MNQPRPRFRMFAGPNGSGKSIIKHAVPPQLLGVYVNPDDIEKKSAKNGGRHVIQAVTDILTKQKPIKKVGCTHTTFLPAMKYLKGSWTQTMV